MPRMPRSPVLVARRGFTLVELVVSMVIITVGVLALVSTSAGVLQQMRSGHQSTLAATVAQSRMETIRSLQCASAASGSATTRGMNETWTISAISARINAVAETVTYTPRVGVTKQLGLSGVVPCV